MSDVKVLSVDLGPVAALDDPVPEERRVAGAPMRGARSTYDSDKDGFYAGVWESEPGAWRVSYDEDELCVILAGRMRLIADDGTVAEYRAGEAFVVPRGFRGTWETIEHVRKIYAISV